MHNKCVHKSLVSCKVVHCWVDTQCMQIGNLDHANLKSLDNSAVKR